MHLGGLRYGVKLQQVYSAVCALAHVSRAENHRVEIEVLAAQQQTISADGKGKDRSEVRS